jgi:glutamyl-tRNA(Gln) amidotransferase subunit D
MNRGDTITVTTSDESYTGRFVQRRDNHVFIKLDSGYNIGIDNDRIDDVTVVEETTTDRSIDEPDQDTSLPNVNILHTGGTIASKVDYETGGVTNAYDVAELLSLFPELHDHAHINSQYVFNKSSEDLRFADYNTIIDHVEEAINDDPSGVIIAVGTDTMHYLGAALSFALRGLPCPVVLVGAQRSSDRPSSDAARNLLSAVSFITSDDVTYNGVAVCMHGSIEDNEAYIHRGVNVRKMHTSRRDAFKSVNDTPLTTVSFDDYTVTESVHEVTDEPFTAATFDTDLRIGWHKARPHTPQDELERFADYDGLILEGTGLGHVGIDGSEDNNAIHDDIARIADDIPTVMTSQTIHGRVNMQVYSHGRRLKDLGILGHGHDETPETAYVKLAWLLSQYDPEKAKQLYDANLAGEHTSNTHRNEYTNHYDG